jgi:hypothetical protein
MNKASQINSQYSNYSQLKSPMTVSKSKKKIIESPKCEMSLNFSNNILQTFLIEVFTKMNLDLVPNVLETDGFNFFNLIKIVHEETIHFIQILEGKLLIELLENGALFHNFEYLKKLQQNSLTIIFHEVNQDLTYRNKSLIKNDLQIFINYHLKFKVFDSSSTSEFLDFFQNYLEKVAHKEEKSKLTFFDAKPATSNLCVIEKITDERTLTWVKQLMCIPGISEIKAIAIAKQYPTIKSLMEIYLSEEYNSNEKEQFLAEVMIENKTKSTKKRLGVALSTKIYRFFNADNPDFIIH